MKSEGSRSCRQTQKTKEWSRMACKDVTFEEKTSMEQQTAAALLTSPLQLEAVNAHSADERTQGSGIVRAARALEQWMKLVKPGGPSGVQMYMDKHAWRARGSRASCEGQAQDVALMRQDCALYVRLSRRTYADPFYRC